MVDDRLQRKQGEQKQTTKYKIVGRMAPNNSLTPKESYNGTYKLIFPAVLQSDRFTASTVP
jgi:hypothetical protein